MQGGVTSIMGIYLKADDIGLFSIAFRISLVVNFILVVVNSIITPRLSILYNLRKNKNLDILIRKTTICMTLFSLLLSIPLLVFSKMILLTFGEAYIEAVPLLKLLVIAQFVNVITGTVSSLMNMTGYAKLNRNINVIVVVVNLSLCLILIPRMGVFGGALSLSTAIILKNLASVLFVRNYIGINIFDWRVK
jgi:O-antigen/teichoic acid export membrane protein